MCWRTKAKWTVRRNSADEPDATDGEPGLPGLWGLQSMQECVATQTSCLEQHTLGSGWVLSAFPPQLFQWLLLPGAPSHSGVSWTRPLSSGAQSTVGLATPSQGTQGVNSPKVKEKAACKKWTQVCNFWEKLCVLHTWWVHVYTYPVIETHLQQVRKNGN